jgi:chromosome segregation ATPase
LAHEIHEYREQKKAEFDWVRSTVGLATKNDLNILKESIMSAISDYAAKQAAFQDRIDTAITGLTADIAELNALIVTLQNTPGPISAEDQATLDTLQARTEAIATKVEALDALTPPAVPKA